MNVRLSARKLAASVGEGLRPIVSRCGVDKAVKDLKRRFGKELRDLDAEGLAAFDKAVVANAIARVARARYALGYKPFSPPDPNEENPVVDDLPIRWLSDAEIIAFVKL